MRTLLTFLAAISFLANSSGQTTQTEFGKNRVQFHNDFAEWSQYESRNFMTYFYGEGRNIGQSVVQMAEYDFYEIQGILEHRMNDKIEIIAYTDLTDLKQSNIGVEEAFVNTGGQTKIVGNKMFVYFNGDHNDLRRQVREGIASVYLNAMLFGSNLQEIVQNAVMMNLPEWFKDGLISYVGEEWNTTLDNQLRDLFLSGKYADFEEMAEANPKLAGHSLWHFISEHYGHSTVSNLLYLTRINRSVESGFLYVLGSTYSNTVESWDAFFRKRYEGETGRFSAMPIESSGLSPIALKNKKNMPVTQLRVSPDGTKFAYVLNEIGRTRVWVQDFATGKRELAFKGGFRNAIQATDYNYPLLAWNPNNQELAILYERRDVPKLLRYNILTKDKITEDLSTQYQRVFSMDFVNVNDLVFSAAVRGQSDLFLYYTQNRQTLRLTNDFWDDLDAVYSPIHGRRGVLFASNRMDSLNLPAALDSVLPIRRYDIFFLNLDTMPTELVRITNTPHADERQPIVIDSTWFGFLTNETGIANRKTGYLEDYIHHFQNVITFKDGMVMRLHADTLISERFDSLMLAEVDTVVLEPVIRQRAVNHFVSNYDRNIIEQHLSRRSGRQVEMIWKDGKWQVFGGIIGVAETDPAAAVTPNFTAYQSQRVQFLNSPGERTANEPARNPVLKKTEDAPVKTENLPQEKQDTGKIDIDNYLFQSEFDDDELPAPPTEEEQPVEPSNVQPLAYLPIFEEEGTGQKVHEFRSTRITPYRTKFRTDFVTTQLDNSLLFDGLNSYAGVPQDFSYPPPGILLKANFKDLMEDYEFEGGVRVPTSFNGAEYFLTFINRKKRLDQHYAVYRRRLRFTPEATPPAIKYENTISLGQYQVRYPLDIFTSIRGTATLRFDNSTYLSTEPATHQAPSLHQQRLGIKVEYVFDNTLDISLNIKNGTRYKFFAEQVKGFEIELQNTPTFKANNGFMTILGADVRHYQRVFKWSVLAGRFAFSSSLGQEKILYLLGGTDNWLIPQFDQTIPLPGGDDFIYRSLATNLRGFKMNVRNGNTYALANAELRMPLFRYLFPRSQSNFVRNFQFIGFFDAGTAWQGLNPFNETSPLNTWTASNPNVTITVNYFRDPIVFGYGGGIRTLLFGYFIRLDYAKGIETRQVQDGKLYFSIGMDF